jgi:hypothetical protein
MCLHHRVCSSEDVEPAVTHPGAKLPGQVEQLLRGLLVQLVPSFSLAPTTVGPHLESTVC